MKLTRILRMINLCEDSLCQARRINTPSRFIVDIDREGLTQEEIESYMEEIKVSLKHSFLLIKQQPNYVSMQQELELLKTKFHETLFRQITSIDCFKAEMILNLIDSLYDDKFKEDSFIFESLRNL